MADTTYSYMRGQSFEGTDSYSYMGAHSYMGTQSYMGAQSYMGTHSYSQGNPMSTAGIANSRADLVLGLGAATDVGGAYDLAASVRWGEDPAAKSPTFDKLPPLGQPMLMRRWSAPVRATLIEFELVSNLHFCVEPDSDAKGPSEPQRGRAVLYHQRRTPQPGKPDSLVSTEIVSMRRPDRAVFKKQLAQVDSLASARDTREPEILSQIAPPIGYFASIANLHSERTPKTLELLALAQHFAYIVEMQFKHALACPRPIEYSAMIQPIIETPAHGSLPSGHATESYLAAGVLGALVPGFAEGDPRRALRRLAYRIATNRVVAGLHFPVDTIAGRLLGDTLASYFVGMCEGTPWNTASFDGTSLASPTEEPDADDKAANPSCTSAPAKPPYATKHPILAELWQAARREWA